MKILIIKPSSFGDIIQANPAAAALRKSYPDADIRWLVFRKWENVVSLFPGINGKVVWNRKGGLKEYVRVINEIRKEKYDLIIDLQGLARTGLIAGFSGAGKVIGVPGMKEFSWLLEKEAYPESKKLNAVLRNLETVRFLTGKKYDPFFDLRVPNEALDDARKILDQNGIGPGDKIITFIPGARGAAKTWPADHYDELAEAVFKRYGAKIVALGTEGDGNKLSNPEIIDISGRTSIQMLAAILASSRAVIGGDTGPVHLAAALGSPVVAIFGGSDINETAPLGSKVRVVSKYMNCSPCRGKPVCKDIRCLTDIKPEEVLKKLNEILVI